jgi:uncharacterized membrane protein (UPF0127 family)
MAMASIGSGTRLAQLSLGRRLLLAAPAVLMAGGALAQSSEITFKKSSLVVVTASREIKFDVELALNEAERARGLMYREKLGPYDGMLFDFYQDAPVSFWMKNTLIPLDMLFVDQRGRIINIHERAVPGSLEPIAAAAPARAVIELNGGTAARLGIKPGDRVIFPIFGDAS